MPSDLSHEAKKAWKKMVPVLLHLGTLTVSDGDALACYCEAKVLWRKAQDEIAVKGMVLGDKKNPAINVAQDCSNTMRALMSEFGLTPASRTKIQVHTPSTQSPLGKLLNERIRVRDAERVTGTG